VGLALLWDYQGGKGVGFPLAALLFVPLALCSARWPATRLTVGGDNLSAKAQLARLVVGQAAGSRVRRLRAKAALELLPPPSPKPRRGRSRLRGAKLRAVPLSRRRSQRPALRGRISGKTVTLQAVVGVVMPSPRLAHTPIRVVSVPQRAGRKMTIFFAPDPTMAPVRLPELSAARFKGEELFDAVNPTGGVADCRQRSFSTLKRHATLCPVAYSLLRLLSVTLKGASAIEPEPWWRPVGPPSVTRLRRAVFKALRISTRVPSAPKGTENIAFKEVA
jgi:hypothetical protein